LTAVSTFTWLDHRDDDQQRVRDALAAFDQPGIVDPLGFGVVRDTFSEMLFPGVSTVQTRARYFVFVPWVYQRLDRERVAPQDGARRARDLELALIEALLRGTAEGERQGIIGRFSRQRTKQLPSFVYWGGLGRWGIRRFPGTRQEYVASLGRRSTRHQVEQDEVDPRVPWPGLPEEPDGLLQESTLALVPSEADFLRDRVLRATKGTYLELLVRDSTPEQDGREPWSHPLAADASPHIREQLHHARLFAVATLGAALLYNRLLSELLEEDGHEPLRTDYHARVDEWLDEVDAMHHDFATWDREALWALVDRENPRAHASRAFIDRWLDRVVRDPRAAAAHPEVVRDLIAQESRIKGPRAKLANRRARERSPGPQGGALMVFRWPQVRQIVGDIHAGLA